MLAGWVRPENRWLMPRVRPASSGSYSDNSLPLVVGGGEYPHLRRSLFRCRYNVADVVANQDAGICHDRPLAAI
jgi:hypothetical protein